MKRILFFLMIAVSVIGSWLILDFQEIRNQDRLVPDHANSRWSENAVAGASALPPPDEVTLAICGKILSIRHDLTERFCEIALQSTSWGRLDAHTSYTEMTKTPAGKKTLVGYVHKCADALNAVDASEYQWKFNPTIHDPFSEIYQVFPDSQACRVTANYHDENIPKID